MSFVGHQWYPMYNGFHWHVYESYWKLLAVQLLMDSNVCYRVLDQTESVGA